jgi:5-bromo-4-chloroindolyl phosphate hydrolysis protein
MAISSNRDLTAGLIAGVAGIASYAVCIFALNMNELTSLVPAILLAGAALLVVPGGPLARRTKPNEQEAHAIAGAAAKIKNLRGYAAQIPANHAVARQLVGEIGDEAARILDAIEKDWNKFQAAEPFLNQYLVPIDSWLSRYVLLTSRGIESAKDFLAQAERKTLPEIKGSLVDLYEKLHVNDVAQFLAGTMGGMNFPNIDLKNEESS